MCIAFATLHHQANSCILISIVSLDESFGVLNPVSISKFVLYCMGEGWVDQRKYGHALREAKTADFKQSLITDVLTNNQRILQETRASLLNPPAILPNLFKQFAQIFVALPLFQALKALFSPALPEQTKLPLWMMGLFTAMAKPSESVLSTLASFFFGTKKSRSEKEEAEKKLREDFDILDTDMLELTQVNKSQAGAQEQNR
jgi:predicted ribosome quality control (RQC) complex YloA/Tae2 family protein